MNPGVPFRETHHIAGAAVKLAEDRGKQLHELTLAELQGINSQFSADVERVFNMENSVNLRNSWGGTSRESVAAQCSKLKQLV